MSFVGLAGPGPFARPVARGGNLAPAASPTIDLASISTPQEAALLPSLTLPLVNLMYNAIGQATQDGQGMEARLQAQYNGDTNASLHYALDPDTSAVKVDGNLGAASVQETWQFSPDGSFTIDGTVGNAEEHLRYMVRPDGTHLDGQVAGMPVHAVFRRYDANTVTGTGTLAGQVYDESDKQVDAAHSNTSGDVADQLTLMHNTLTYSTPYQYTQVGAGQLAGINFQYREDGWLTGDPPPSPTPPPPDPGPDPDGGDARASQ